MSGGQTTDYWNKRGPVELPVRVDFTNSTPALRTAVNGVEVTPRAQTA